MRGHRFAGSGPQGGQGLRVSVLVGEITTPHEHRPAPGNPCMLTFFWSGVESQASDEGEANLAYDLRDVAWQSGRLYLC